MKYMCWLYYKFERIVNVLGGETLPKILYAGDVSHYELQLLTVLSRAGADIVLLECGGDQAYLTVDPQSALSHLYQALAWGPSRRASVSSSFRRSWSGRCAASGSTARRPPSLPAPTLGAEGRAEHGADGCAGRGNRSPLFLQPLPLPVRRGGQSHLYQRPLRVYQSLQGGGAGSAWSTETPRPPGRRRSPRSSGATTPPQSSWRRVSPPTSGIRPMWSSSA